jgi:hypothetical protein
MFTGKRPGTSKSKAKLFDSDASSLAGSGVGSGTLGANARPAMLVVSCRFGAFDLSTNPYT